jgi:mannitol-1-phosphate 5-dehydrogenase
MKAVHFGAGNIGRGFIGLLLSRSGYNVCFVDINDKVVSLLQQRGEYTVELANEARETTIVEGVSAIHSKYADKVAQSIASAVMVTTAVGVTLLDTISEVIAKGIEMKFQASSSEVHLQIIACENTIGGSSLLKEHVYTRLSEETRSKADRLISFPNAAVDRIIPIQRHEDPLKVTVEPFYEWIIDRSSLPEDAALIEGVQYVDQMEPYIERKLFTVNTGHCAAAYLGYISGFKTIHEALSDEAIARQVRQVLQETGACLIKKHGFDPQDHSRYVDKIIERFRNSCLIDEVYRVARSPIRKLSRNDRLVLPALQSLVYGVIPEYLALVMAAALLFDFKDDAEAAELQTALQTIGVPKAIEQYTGIPEGHSIHDLILRHYHSLKQRIDNHSQISDTR